MPEKINITEYIQAPMRGNSFETFVNYILIHMSCLKDGPSLEEIFGRPISHDITVEFKINDVELPFIEALRPFYEQYRDMIKKEATRIVTEHISQRYSKLYSALDDVEKVIKEEFGLTLDDY